MEENLIQKAIKLSLENKWSEAIKVNKLILKSTADDTDTLNRLARAYYETGDCINAKKISHKVLKLEPSNKIAGKSLERYKTVKRKQKVQEKIVNASDFIEESGKTKLTLLLNLGSEKAISSLCSGDEVVISTHAHKVSITTLDGLYIGKLPDDLSARIRTLVKGGNKYKVLIKSVNKNNIKIFIREIVKGKDTKDIQSFPRETSETIDEFSAES